jgi:hypothetical protein
MMRRILSAILTLLPMCLSAQEYLPAWEEGYMDIHTIGGNQGECQLLVMPDGTTMLIDAGDNPWPHGDNVEWAPVIPDPARIAGEAFTDYIRHFTKGLPSEGTMDYVFLTHFHTDHMGCVPNSKPGSNGYRLSGMTYLAEQFRFGKWVDRDYPKYDFPSRKRLESYSAGFVNDVIAMVSHKVVSEGMSAEEFVVGSATQFHPVHNPKPYRKSFHIRNIVGEGYAWTGKGEESKKIYTLPVEQTDENMMSCGIVVHYGDFAYSNLGDLHGGSWSANRGKNKGLEPYVADVMGKITVHKPSHHGWKDSSCARLLLATQPDVFIFPSSNKDHPFKGTFERIDDPLLYDTPREYYITHDFARHFLGRKNWEKFKPYGHIVCRVYPGGNTYQMFVLDIFSADYRVIYKSPVRTVNVKLL